jgi:hypothetical protein
MSLFEMATAENVMSCEFESELTCSATEKNVLSR